MTDTEIRPIKVQALSNKHSKVKVYAREILEDMLLALRAMQVNNEDPIPSLTPGQKRAIDAAIQAWKADSEERQADASEEIAISLNELSDEELYALWTKEEPNERE